jgi:aconitate hydratase
MGLTLTAKILQQHCLKGKLTAGEEIAVKVHQTLTQDSTGTMVYLQLLALDPQKVQTDVSVAYIDHNMLQTGFENADDHVFIQSVAQHYGIITSKAGGGICHQVHLERFAKPNTVLIGSDSHTPTCGGVGALAIGTGGLDVAVGMAKGLYFLKVPKVYQIILTGKPSTTINGKDIILSVLRHISVTGGLGHVLEYTGDGIQHLSVTDRATICNMGAEAGATTSIFPSDQQTLTYLTQQGRPQDYVPLAADPDAVYDQTLTLDLSAIVPMVAKPHSPDNVVPVSEVTGVKIDQVAIGSCTNSSYADMMKVAMILKGRQVHPDVSLVITPGSANILRLMAENGALADMVTAGARILESACGPCIGMGQAPRSGGVSLRTFNRNFKGRSGTADAQVYIVSPETAAYSAITGTLSDPRDLNQDLRVIQPASYGKVDRYFVYPGQPKTTPVVMGPNIKPFPLAQPLPDQLRIPVLLSVGDNVTTDDIVPSHAKLLPFRSNIPHLATFCFTAIDPTFAQRAADAQGGIIVAKSNYGQGSSREHAALIPLYLGIKAVMAISFARIHRSNLINAGILPLVVEEASVIEAIQPGDVLAMDDLLSTVDRNGSVIVRNETQGTSFACTLNLSAREAQVLRHGGYLNTIKAVDLQEIA